MTVTVTERAARQIQSQLAKNPQMQGLRVGVKTSGCSGYGYELSFAEAIGEADEVFEQHGAKVVVSRQWLPFLDGMELDYVREGLNNRFTFNNPNVSGSCGCGESFAV